MALESVDRLLFARRSPEYDCLDLACEAWQELTGEDIRARLGELLGRAGRKIGATRSSFTRLREVEDPCLVVFHSDRGDPHVGVYLRGRVLHLLGRSPEYMELDVAARGFTKIRYFR